MKRKQWKKIGTLILFLALAAFALSGCSGSDGSAGATGVQGPAGPAGPQGPAGQVVVNPETLSAAELSALTLKGEITSVTIASANTTRRPRAAWRRPDSHKCSGSTLDRSFSR